MNDIDDKLNELLHDAEHAEAGEVMARVMKDAAAVSRFRSKATRLVDKARKLDPQFNSRHWQETTCVYALEISRKASK